MSALSAFPDSEMSVQATTDQTVPHVGLVTRAIAFTVDAALIILVAIVVGVGVSLILSRFHFAKGLHTVLVAIGAVACILWSLGYFVTFWSTTGQTPGARLMQIRLTTADGKPLKPCRAHHIGARRLSARHARSH
jgi:uncharacterized RDD family membrane protein YckC